jgi:hypothetical protein
MRRLRLTFVLVALLVAAIFYWPTRFDTHYATQYRCETQVSQAVEHFAYLQHADTLDFASIAPFPWDTVYVFEGYTSGTELARDLGRINWATGLQEEDIVPEHVNRFIFVRGQQAVAYVDIEEKTIDFVHFSSYYLDERGYYTSYWSDSTGTFHNYSVNHFTRAQAKFIVVLMGQGKGVPSSPLAYLLRAKTVWHLPIETAYQIALHPLSGCGFSDCLGNKPLPTQRGMR